MEHLSAWTLDGLELGFLDGDDLAAARAHIAGCPRCARDFAELRSARGKFEADVFARTLPAVEKKRSRRRWYWLLCAPALAAAAAIALVLVPRTTDETGPDLVAKGGPICEVFARRQDRVFAVQDGAALAPGDEIRFVVQPAGHRHVLVASVDAAGVASVYAPFGAQRSLRLRSLTDRAELPGSVRLDATPGPERIYCLFSRRPIEAQPVLARLREMGAAGPAMLRAAPVVAIPSVVVLSALVEKVVP
jgi:hypothetical protein